MAAAVRVAAIGRDGQRERKSMELFYGLIGMLVAWFGGMGLAAVLPVRLNKPQEEPHQGPNGATWNK